MRFRRKGRCGHKKKEGRWQIFCPLLLLQGEGLESAALLTELVLVSYSFTFQRLFS
jgi:hypothetical protein